VLLMLLLKKWRSQTGLTMVELMVAIAISMLIVVGSVALMTYMITVADDNRDKTMATLEVQYVGFWISEDVVQAQTIEFGENNGFPLTITWRYGDGSANETITYYFEDMEEEQGLLILMRTREVYREGSPDHSQSGTSQVAQYLVPWSESKCTGTKCCRMEYSTEYDSMKSVVVEVAAKADRSEASSSYEIYPRAAVDWSPKDAEGYYIGGNCEECTGG